MPSRVAASCAPRCMSRKNGWLSVFMTNAILGAAPVSVELPRLQPAASPSIASPMTSALASRDMQPPYSQSRYSNKDQTVGVGMPIAGHPLHRSGRAALPHPAPTLGRERKALIRVRMTNMGNRKPARTQTHHALPRHEGGLAAPHQRGTPASDQCVAKRMEARRVPRHPIVTGVPHHDRAQVGPLFRNGRVHASPQFGGHLLQLRMPLPPHRLAQYREPTRPRLAAAMREAEEVERLRFPIATASPIPVGTATELDEARLVGMQRQTEPREPLAQVREKADGFLPMFESDDEVVSKPDDDDVALRLPRSPSLGPEVEDVVEIDVGQQRTDTAALHRPHLTPHSLPLLQHARPQPLLDEAHDAPVRNTVLDEADEPFVVQRVEEPPNVRIEHPVHAPRFDADRERIHRLVCTAPGPIPVREAQELRLVNRVQHLDDGALDEFVLQRGNPERPLPPVRLRDVHASNWTGPERAPLHAGGEVVKVGLQRLAIVPPRLAVNARGGVPLQRSIRRTQALDVVHVVQQRGEPLCPVPFCYLTYPLEAIRRVDPALSPAVVTIGRVPFGQPASLHHLRSRFRGLVRRLRRYYQAVRLPVVVHHRRESLDFPTRPATLLAPGDHGLSRFPNAALPRMHGVSDRAGFRRTLHWRSVGCGLPPISTASAPRCASLFRGSIPGPRVPLSTLRRRSCPRQRMTRGRCGSLRLQRFELASIAPRRFHRRTEKERRREILLFSLSPFLLWDLLHLPCQASAERFFNNLSVPDRYRRCRFNDMSTRTAPMITA